MAVDPAYQKLIDANLIKLVMGQETEQDKQKRLLIPDPMEDLRKQQEQALRPSLTPSVPGK